VIGTATVAPDRALATSVVGLRPLALKLSSSGEPVDANGMRASSVTASGDRLTMTSDFCSSSRIAA
jgi:hypothetical protein